MTRRPFPARRTPWRPWRPRSAAPLSGRGCAGADQPTSPSRRIWRTISSVAIDAPATDRCTPSACRTVDRVPLPAHRARNRPCGVNVAPRSIEVDRPRKGPRGGPQRAVDRAEDRLEARAARRGQQQPVDGPGAAARIGAHHRRAPGGRTRAPTRARSTAPLPPTACPSGTRRWRRGTSPSRRDAACARCARACASQLNMNGLEIPVEMCASLRTEIGPRRASRRCRSPSMIWIIESPVASTRSRRRGGPHDEHALGRRAGRGDRQGWRPGRARGASGTAAADLARRQSHAAARGAHAARLRRAHASQRARPDPSGR